MKQNILLFLMLIVFNIASASNWNVVKYDDGNNMTGVVMVKIDGVEQASSNLMLGTFNSDGLCRGKATPIISPQMKYVYNITVYGAPNEVLSFKLLDNENNLEVEASTSFTVTYQTNGHFGGLNTYIEFLSGCTFANNGSWSDLNNWNNGSGNNPENFPTVFNNLIINADVEIEQNTVAYANNITINEGKTLTINGGGSLRIEGAITNNGSIIVEAQAPSRGTFGISGSLLHQTAEISGTVQCYLDNSNTSWDWHFLSSPVASHSISGEFITSGHDNDYDFYMYHEPSATWFNKKKEGASNFNTYNGDNFVVGRGYMVAYQVADNKSFTGTLNQGEITIPLTFTNTINGMTNNYPQSVISKFF